MLLFRLSLLALTCLIFGQSRVLAEIQADGTLGSESSILIPGVEVKGAIGNRIDGGAVRGANLFHSFGEFSIGDGQQVYFSNPTGIENILTRVTGNNPSNILGTLGVLGNANLFFINPNGIVFGGNARLDVAGSFVASTADSLVFDNSFAFSASNPQAPPLLTINLNPGLQLGNEVGTITSSGNLVVGQNLTLSAYSLDLQGSLQAGQDLMLNALDKIQVRDATANPFIATAGKTLLIQGNEGVDIFALDHSDSGFFSGGDMILRSSTQVSGDAHYWSGGNFRIEELDGNLGNLFSPYGPIIRANGDVSVASFTGASLHIFAGGKVEIPGNITVFRPDNLPNAIAETITLSDGSTLNINGSAEPTLDIRAGINWQTLPQNSTIGQLFVAPTFNNSTSADINIGSIQVFDFLEEDGGKIFLTNKYQPNTSLTGNIIVNQVDVTDYLQGGSLLINSRGNISLNTVDVSALGQGNGGNITLIADTDIRSNFLASEGWLGGNITLKSDGNISLSGGSIFSSSLANTDTNSPLTGGNIDIRADSLFLTDNADITIANDNLANGGNLKITANRIFLDNGQSNGSAGGIISQVAPGAMGKGGDIQVTTDTLSAENGSQVIAITSGFGRAGDVTIQASDRILFSGFSSNDTPSGAASFSVATGAGGDVNISTRTLSILNTAQVRTGAFAQGNSGNVKINATDAIFLDGDQSAVVSVVFSDATAEGGDINLTTGKLAILNGAAINSATIGIGNAGNIQINADSITVDGASPFTGFGSEISAVTDNNAQGNAGNINIISRSLALTNSGQITASTNAKGKAGNITITTTESVLIDGINPLQPIFPSGILSLVRANGEGEGGNIEIRTGNLSLTNGGFLDASTFGRGNAGNITITANDAVILNSGNNSNLVSDISSKVLSGAIGNSGDISIFAKTLLLSNGSQIAADTFGRGNSGDITINTIDSVILDAGSRTTNLTGIFTTVGNGGFGSGGDIAIATENLVITNNNAQVNAATFGQGKAGNIEVTANTLQFTNSGKLLTTTGSSDDAGDINLKISELVYLAGDRSGIFANTNSNSTGNSGNIFIDPKVMIIRDGAKIAVDNQGTGIGGTINIQAGKLTLDNQAVISAETASNTGGDIQLQLTDLLLLRRNSTISTTAGTTQAGGNGGNISIKSPFILAVASENNDITANAFSGNGGRVDITTQRIFGLTPRSRSDLERLLATNDPEQLNPRSLPTSDITAISQANPSFSEQVVINTADVDPSNGLVNLPTNLVDASQLIAQTCRTSPEATANQQSEFIVTGRGGLPPNPIEPLSSDAIWEDLQLHALLNEKVTGSQQEVNLVSETPSAIAEAQGWVTNPDGTITLVAQAPNTTPHSSSLTPVSCPVAQN